MTLEQFKNETMGGVYGNPPPLLVRNSGTYQGQCVSLVRQYMEVVLGVPSRSIGNAVDYYNSAFMAQSFDKVPQGQEQNGDILCWGNDAGGMTGPEGHIAISYSPGIILNQNYGGSLRVSMDTFFTAGYQGALRLKGGNVMLDGNQIQALFRAFRLRAATPDEIKTYVGTPYSPLLVQLDSGDERKQAVHITETGKIAVKDNWSGQIDSLTAENKDLKKQLAECGTGDYTKVIQASTDLYTKVA